jgi:TPR repeat protein
MAEQPLVDQLKQGRLSDPALVLKGNQSADQLFLLGWLYMQGGYGVPRDEPMGRELLQQAADQGHFDAMQYCWNRCLVLTTEVVEHIKRGAAAELPQALYLQAQLASAAKADRLLLRAAELGHRQAIELLYSDYFVVWAKQVRTLEEAVAKLENCADEGVVFCFYMLAALHERHQDHAQALFYYQVYALADPEPYQQLHSESHLQQLLGRLPQARMDLILSRAASYLAGRPVSGNERIDRFQRCRQQAGYRCVQQLSDVDRRCLPPYTDAAQLQGWRDSPGYQRCAALTSL